MHNTFIVHVCVLYNLTGTSSTQDIAAADDDTTESAIEVRDALKHLGHEAELLGITQKDIEGLATLKADLVFNLVEWTGREMTDGVRVLQILEAAHIPYTGCSADGYRISSDKWEMKRIMQDKGIPTPKWTCVDAGDNTFSALNTFINNAKFPLIVKPSLEHCAIGITNRSVVNNENDLRIMIHELLNMYKQPVLVEEFIDGPEAHVTVMDTKNGVWVLPPAVFEYEKKAGLIPAMTYEAKWGTGPEAHLTEWVNTIDEKLDLRIREVAQQAFEMLGGRSYSRIDMRIRGTEVYVLEINNNPGIGWDEDAGLTHSTIAAGLDFEGFIKTIIESI